MQSVRIYEMPSCKMVSSGTGMFGGRLKTNANFEFGKVAMYDEC